MRKTVEGSNRGAVLSGTYSGLCIGILYSLFTFLHLNRWHEISIPSIVPIATSILVTVFFLNFRGIKYLFAYLFVSTSFFISTDMFAAILLSPLLRKASGPYGDMGFLLGMMYIYPLIGGIIGTIIAIAINNLEVENSVESKGIKND